MYEFHILQGTVATFCRCGKYVQKHLGGISSEQCVPKTIQIGLFLNGFVKNDNMITFWEAPHMLCIYCTMRPKNNYITQKCVFSCFPNFTGACGGTGVRERTSANFADRPYTATAAVARSLRTSNASSFQTPFPPLSCNACLEVKREDNQNCSVPCCVLQFVVVHNHKQLG